MGTGLQMSRHLGRAHSVAADMKLSCDLLFVCDAVQCTPAGLRAPASEAVLQACLHTPQRSPGVCYQPTTNPEY